MKNKIRLRTLIWSLFLAMPFLVISCYPDGPAVTEDLDLVGTLHDEDFNFAAAVTYSMPDTVIHVIGEDEKEEDVDHSLDDHILTNVRNNMDAMGYTYQDFDTTQITDLVLLVSVYSNVNTGIFYNPGGWWGYWGWWPGWGTGYPWGPGWGIGMPWGYPIGYSYSTGTIFITMINPEEFDLDEQTVGAVWLASMNGLASGDKSRVQSRITDGIAQAFKQSESYLKK